MKEQGTLRSYITGFILSIAATLAAYIVVDIHVNSGHETISHPVLLATILALAVLQLIIQMVFFLHLGFGSGERWRMVAFVLTIGLVILVVGGSIWIMGHLNANMTPAQLQQYMQDQQGF